MSFDKFQPSAVARPKTAGMPILSELDMERLKRCARVPGASSEQRTLVEELEGAAMLLDAAEVPPDVVIPRRQTTCRVI